MSDRDPPPDQPPITRILRQLAAGEAGAADELLPLVYEELRQLARGRMAQLKPGQTMQATALVHEAWVNLGAREAVHWDDRSHFFGSAACAMRFILVQQARSKRRQKRGGDQQREPLYDIEAPMTDSGFDLEALDQALTRLEAEHELHARLVNLRYFGGLGMQEIADMLSISLRTAERSWVFARSWLRRELGPAEGGEA